MLRLVWRLQAALAERVALSPPTSHSCSQQRSMSERTSMVKNCPLP